MSGVRVAHQPSARFVPWAARREQTACHFVQGARGTRLTAPIGELGARAPELAQG